MKRHSWMPSPAMIVALMALTVALGGSAWAVSKVGTKQIRKGAVTTPKIRDGAVKTPKLGDGAVTSSKLPGGVVTAEKLGDGSVTSSKIAAGSVGPGQLGTVPAVILTWTTNAFDVETGTETPLLSGWEEVVDTAGMWPGEAGVVAIPRDGLYRVDAQVLWSTSLGGQREVWIENLDAPSAEGTIGSVVRPTAADTLQNAGGLIKAEAGDRLTVWVQQNSGTSLFIGNNTLFLGGTKLSVAFAGRAD